ncbi:hypothetical protein V7V80_26020 [Pseudomonas kermanshahensis]|uniref:Guanylate cyclase domain-containing protein n=1 Tax=Pseudomonas kermanshahensis TaxID=2745482 RepID=A0ABU8RE25_9PSED
MTDRLLLYIDILGFTEMVRKDPRKVARVYSILDSLNVHRHNSFKTIVFSDTVLVYNAKSPANDENRRYLVWYLTEFAEDLHHRLIGQDIYFRAALVAGDFFHYELNHVECFFGSALITAYLAEKDIPSLGLFMDKESAKYNQFFRLDQFNSDFSFVYLNRQLEMLNKHAFGQFPNVFDIPVGDIAPDVYGQIKFLQHIHDQMRSHPSPQVRIKFLAAWDFHKKRYPQMLRVLEDNEFRADSLGASGDWKTMEKVHDDNVAYFKRIGSGTVLSMSITGAVRKNSKSPNVRAGKISTPAVTKSKPRKSTLNKTVVRSPSKLKKPNPSKP